MGPCVVDPANGICSEACDFWTDCCKCDGQILLPDPLASNCTLAMGIVRSECPWSVNDMVWDGKELSGLENCAGAVSGWTQFEQDGDIIVELCGQTCTDYLAGEFRTLEV